MLDKKIICFDMDGTLAEWRDLHLDFKSDESAKSAQEKVYEILMQPNYYKSLNPYENVVALCKESLQNKEDVYLLSCYIKNSPCKQEKIEWKNKYIPDLSDGHCILVPDGLGHCKFDYVPRKYEVIKECRIPIEAPKGLPDTAARILAVHLFPGEILTFQRDIGFIREESNMVLSQKILSNVALDNLWDSIKDVSNDYQYVLIDDHTPNLIAWEKQNPNNIGIKLINPKNGKNGKWQGEKISYDDIHLYETLQSILSDEKSLNCEKQEETIER